MFTKKYATPKVSMISGSARNFTSGFRKTFASPRIAPGQDHRPPTPDREPVERPVGDDEREHVDRPRDRKSHEPAPRAQPTSERCGIARARMNRRGEAVAAAKPTPSGICPAAGGDQRRESTRWIPASRASSDDAAVAAAKRTPSGICPAAGGDRAAGIHSAESRFADKFRTASAASARRPCRPGS